MEDIEFIVAIVAGLFSLLGGFLGAFLSRRTEYEKWLRQQQSMAFEEFMSHLNQFRKAAVDILYDTDLDQNDKDMAISECFYELNSQEYIVRLYLTGSSRERFSELKNEIWLVYSSAVNQTTRLNKLQNATSEIQAIFEEALHG